MLDRPERAARWARRTALLLLVAGLWQVAFAAWQAPGSARDRDRALGRYLGMDPAVVYPIDGVDVPVGVLQDRERRAHVLGWAVPAGVGAGCVLLAWGARRRPRAAVAAALVLFTVAHAGAGIVDRSQLRRGLIADGVALAGIAVAAAAATARAAAAAR
ncbi:MAG: hypothetical protein AB7O97_22135 [Planctomycetota bacterium]